MQVVFALNNTRYWVIFFTSFLNLSSKSWIIVEALHLDCAMSHDII